MPATPPSPMPESDAAPPLSGDQVLGFVFLALALMVIVGGVALFRWVITEPEAADPPLSFRVDVNTADAATLQLLPGVGPSIAQRIIEERQRRRFDSADDLLRVDGIGPRTAERMTPYIVFTPPLPEGEAGIGEGEAPPSQNGNGSAEPRPPDVF